MSTTCLVTGVAGFIGSHLAERLLREGYRVVGLDCFSDYYPRPLKEANLSGLRGQAGFDLREQDLCTADLEALLREEGVEVIFHEAAQAGVRRSWGREFEIYTQNNVLATQRLLEAARAHGVSRFIYASSSSIYGDTDELPMRETARSPFRPMGSASWLPSTSASSTMPISACRPYRCATLPSMAPGSGRIWPSTASSRPSCGAKR